MSAAGEEDWDYILRDDEADEDDDDDDEYVPQPRTEKRRRAQEEEEEEDEWPQPMEVQYVASRAQFAGQHFAQGVRVWCDVEDPGTEVVAPSELGEGPKAPQHWMHDHPGQAGVFAVSRVSPHNKPKGRNIMKRGRKMFGARAVKAFLAHRRGLKRKRAANKYYSARVRGAGVRRVRPRSRDEAFLFVVDRGDGDDGNNDRGRNAKHYVTTTQAAALVGCTHHDVKRWARRHGVAGDQNIVQVAELVGDRTPDMPRIKASSLLLSLPAVTRLWRWRSTLAAAREEDVYQQRDVQHADMHLFAAEVFGEEPVHTFCVADGEEEEEEGGGVAFEHERLATVPQLAEACDCTAAYMARWLSADAGDFALDIVRVSSFVGDRMDDMPGIANKLSLLLTERVCAAFACRGGTGDAAAAPDATVNVDEEDKEEYYSDYDEDDGSDYDEPPDPVDEIRVHVSDQLPASWSADGGRRYYAHCTAMMDAARPFAAG